MKRVKAAIAAMVMASAFVIGSVGQTAQAASNYATTETYYGAGYYVQDKTYNMQLQMNFGGSGSTYNRIISGYTSVQSASVGSANIVSIVSNAYASADDAIANANGVGGYGNGGSASVSVRYTTSKTAKAVYTAHTNHSTGREHDVYLFDNRS